MANSKELGHYDSSGFDFAQEMLNGDVTAAINFDRVQRYRNAQGQEVYMIFEYLLCEEDQIDKHGITPFRSHPNRYLSKNKRKFLSLWAVAQRMRAELYLVNYAKAGTRCADEILLMQVHNVTDKEVSTTDFRMSRRAFQAWFRYQNARCLDDGAHPEPPTFLFARGGYLHRSARCPYLKGKRDMQLLLEDEVSPHALRPCKTCWEAGR